MGWNLLGGLMPPEVSTAEERERRHSGDLGTEEEFEALDNENQEISYDKDLSLENTILANFPDGCNRSFIVESKDEGSYDIIPKNLTFDDIVNIFGQAVRKDNFEELDKVVQNIEEYEGRSIKLDIVSFCKQQLSLDSLNNQHIYSNILSRYNFDQENFECAYAVKELVLLAIAANDKLSEKYQDILFAEENLSLLPLLVGSQKYIEVFIEKFCGIDGIYDKIKNQAIQLDKSNKIGFFSVIALRKEQKLLETVLVEYVLRDLKYILKKSDPNPVYGVLETASLAKNENFITIVLNAFDRRINEPTKDLLKRSFVTLLETAISQEHISVIEYLCKRYINNKGSTSYDIYEQAFADDKVIKMLNQQILKKIEARNRKEIYDLVLKTALNASNITFIERLCEECTKCTNDIINYLNQKSENNEFDNAYESALIALSNVENKDIIINVIAHVLTYQNMSYNKQTIKQVIQNTLKNAIKQENYVLIQFLCDLSHSDQYIPAIQKIYQEEFQRTLLRIDKDLDEVRQLLNKRPKASVLDLGTMCYNNIIAFSNKVIRQLYNQVQEESEFSSEYIAMQEKEREGACEEEVQFDHEYMRNCDIHGNLLHIKCLLQDAIDAQQLANNQRADSSVYAESSVVSSTDSRQPQGNAVDKVENIMDNQKVSIEEAIGNNCEGGKMLNVEKGSSNTTSGVEGKKLEDNNEAFKEANKMKVTQPSKASKSKNKKSKKSPKKEPSKIAALSGDNVKATASSQEVPAVEFKESSPSLSFDDDDSSLKSDKSAGTSSSSPSLEMMNMAEPKIMLPVVTEKAETELGNTYVPEAQLTSGDKGNHSNQEQDIQSETSIAADNTHEPTVQNPLDQENTSLEESEQKETLTQTKEPEGSELSLSSEENKNDQSDKSAGTSSGSDSPSFEVIDNEIVHEMAEPEAILPAETELGNTYASGAHLPSGDKGNHSDQEQGIQLETSIAADNTHEPTVQKPLNQALEEKELEHIAVTSSVNNNVEGVGVTANSQEIHVAEPEGSELSLSSEENKNDQSDKSAENSSGSRSPSEMVTHGEVRTPIPAVQVEPGTSPSIVIEKTDDSDYSEDPTLVDPQVAEDTKQMAKAAVGTPVLATAGTLGAAIYKATRSTTHDDTAPSPLGTTEKPIPESQSNFDGNNDSRKIPPADNTNVKRVDSNEEEQRSAERIEQVVNEDTQPKSVANEQASDSNKKTAPQNTKRYIVAASALAIAGIALGVAVAVYLEMLAVGAAAAVCYLIAATITYCYRPKSSLEDNEVEKVDVTKKSTPCCS